MTFGEQLRRLRIEANLSQSELAGEGLSASYISLLEAGKRTPRAEVVRQLATRLGCSPSSLFDHTSFERDDRVDLELAFARMAVAHGQAPEARRRLEGLLAEENLPQRELDEINYQLGVVCHHSGDPVAAVHLLLPLFERASVGQTSLLVSTVGAELCCCYRDAGDLSQALRVGGAALTLADAQGMAATYEFCWLAVSVMEMYAERGDHPKAREWADRLLASVRTDGRPDGQDALYRRLGSFAEGEGRTSEALELYERALDHLSELDGRLDLARLQLRIAIALVRDDHPQISRAIDLLQLCADEVTRLGNRNDGARWSCAMSVALLHKGDLSAAESVARRAVDLSEDAGDEKVQALQVLGDVLAARGMAHQADLVRQALFEAMDAMGPSRSAALRWRELAERLVVDDPVAALRAFRRALDAANVWDRGRIQRAQVDALRSRPFVSAGRR